MILPSRVTSVISKIPDTQAREAVARFLLDWEQKGRVFSHGALTTAHRYPPPVRVALKLSQVPGADLASWALNAATMLDWVIEAFGKMFRKTGYLNPSLMKECEAILGRRR